MILVRAVTKSIDPNKKKMFVRIKACLLLLVQLHFQQVPLDSDELELLLIVQFHLISCSVYSYTIVVILLLFSSYGIVISY